MNRNLLQSRFDPQEEEPLGPLANLVDILLVFACGLIAALFADRGALERHLRRQVELVEPGRELPEPPAEIGRAGSGYESVGRVYRDPKTGKLILIGDD
ncbi:MAG: membrane protein [Porticoccaceae bacterium]|nr:MAG: membrane protein [Porticoccaceae bacterium]